MESNHLQVEAVMVGGAIRFEVVGVIAEEDTVDLSDSIDGSWS